MKDSRTEQIFEEASSWLVELHEGEEPERVAVQFMQWLRTSPQHVAAYLEMAALWSDIPRLASKENIDIAALLASVRDDNDATFPVTPAHRSQYRIVRSRVAWMAALGACIAVALAFWMYLLPKTYITSIGELRSISLEDGSTIDLDTKSRIRVRLSRHARDVELLEGQALFRVAKDAARPFIVSSGEQRVRAVGTEFDMYRKATGAMTVSVIEGRIALLPGAGRQEVLLGSGEQATVTAQSVSRSAVADLASLTAWKQRSLIFRGTPLGEVVEEFNRYNRAQIVVDSDPLRTVRVSAVFLSTDPAALLRFLREQPGISASESGDTTHISRNRVE